MKQTMTWAEWKQLLRTRKMIVPMIAILFIPVLYAGMFLWAFWDPYTNLNELPVAIINEDTGAEMNGETLMLGKELTNQLIDSEQFRFEELSREEAEKGLANQQYYVLIEIPENFSRHATTLLEEQPEKLTIVYRPNEGFNFLSAQIGETAMDRIQAEVNEKISKTYAEQLFDTIAKMGDGYGEAASGAGELHKGAEQLKKGSAELKDYLQTLASSTITLADGSNELANGVRSAADGSKSLQKGLGELKEGSSALQAGAQQTATGAVELQQGVSSYTDGVAKLTESYRQMGEKEQLFTTSLETVQTKTTQLNASTAQLATGAQQVSNGMAQLTDQLSPVLAALPPEQKAAVIASLEQLKQGSQQVSGGLQQLQAGTTALDGGLQQLNASAKQLASAHAQGLAGLQTLSSSSPALREGATKLAEGNQALSNGMTTLSSGIVTASDGSVELSAGLAKLAAGTGQLQQGTTQLASSSQQLASGSATLANGMEEMNEGTRTLQEKLAEANEAASEVKVTDKTYEMTAAPVDVETDSMHHVPNYGTGFAPYFLSLGLFVGALLLSIVFPLVEPAMKPTGPLRWFTSKVTILAVVGLVQALLAVVVIVFGLKMEVNNLSLFIITAIITSYTFIALVQMLVTFMSDAGRFVAIIILILQLTTSAGTFPLELIPASLQPFNRLLPMTYSVQAFKAAISTGDTAFLWTNNGVLIGFTVACLVLTFGYFALVYTRRYSKKAIEA